MRIAFLFLCDIGYVFAVDGDGSVLDLKWPFLNLFILGTLITWKIKKPLTEMFNKNFSDVGYLYNVAEERDKESNMKYEIYKKKIENMDKEYDVILKKFDVKGINYVKEYKKEGDIFVEKIKKAKYKRIEVEREKMLKEIENTLIEEIVFKTKNRIKDDSHLKSRVATGLLSKIG